MGCFGVGIRKKIERKKKIESESNECESHSVIGEAMKKERDRDKRGKGE